MMSHHGVLKEGFFLRIIDIPARPDTYNFITKKGWFLLKEEGNIGIKNSLAF